MDLQLEQQRSKGKGESSKGGRSRAKPAIMPGTILSCDVPAVVLEEGEGEGEEPRSGQQGSDVTYLGIAADQRSLPDTCVPSISLPPIHERFSFFPMGFFF